MNLLQQRIANLSPEKQALLEARLLEKAAPKGVTIPQRDRSKPCRLSYAQEQLWFLEQVHSDTPTYNISEILRLRGPLDLGALQRAVSELFARHEGFRTIFQDDTGIPVQVVHPPSPRQLAVLDLEQMPESQRLPEACRLVDEEARRVFHLSAGPPVRFQLLRLSEQDWVFGIHVHHIVADGWSIGILARELGMFYHAYATGEALRLPHLPIQYADYAQWQRSWVESGACDPHLIYWKEKLAGAPELVTLNGDRPRSGAQSFRGGFQSRLVPRELVEQLLSVGRREGATLFMTLLAILDVVLMVYTGREDLVVGTSVAGRNLAELETIIGTFVNMLVLRTDVTGNPSFRELLRRVRKTATEAFAHQEAPFEKLVEVLRPVRTPSYNPLFQVALIPQDTVSEEFRLSGLALSRLPVSTGTSKFDLTLYAWERSDGLLLGFEYSSDLFDDSTIQRLSGHFHKLMQSVVADPDCQIGQLPLLTEAERHQLLYGWNAETQRDYATHECIHELFEAQVQRTPDAVAVVDGFRRLTYQELNRRANQVAAALRHNGVGPEVLVGVCLGRSADMIAALLGILKAGGAYVPLDPDYPKDRIAFIVDDAQAPVVLTQRDLLEKLPPTQSKRICLEDLLSNQIEAPALDFGPAPQPTNLAYVIYTSGSTGRPKGVAIEHRSAVVLVRWAHEVFTREELAGVLFSTSICFDLSVFELFVTLGCGGRVIVAPNALSLPDLPAREEVTLINTVPSAMTELVRLKAVPRSVSVVNLAGEPLRTILVDQVYALGQVRKVYDLYGPSEDTTYSTFALRSPNSPATIGRPIANTQVYLLDRCLQPVPVGVVGEIYLGGAGLARGYLNRPQLTTERFIPNPFHGSSDSRLYCTGDLGRFRPDGNLEYLGRADHQVKIRGFRIELGEIEVALTRVPGVAQAAVVAREDTPGDKRLAAYLVANGSNAASQPVQGPRHSTEPARGEHGLSMASLRDALRKTLPDYMIPSTFVVLEAFPMTPNGKVDRNRLPTPASVGSSAPVEYEAPRGETEERLAEIYASLLNAPRVGRKDNFFELGGHSILAVTLFSEIERIFRIRLPLATLFRAPTIEQIAPLLQDRLPQPAQWSSLVAIQPQGSKPRFFCVHGAGGNVLLYRKLAVHFGESYPLYGLQAQGLDGTAPVLLTVEAMAESYCREILDLQPRGPYCLGGYCLGGTIALEMAQRLRRAGHVVGLVALLDTYNVTRETLADPVRHLRQKMAFHFNTLTHLPLKHWPGYWHDKLRVARDGEFSSLLKAIIRSFKRSGQWSVRKPAKPSLQEVNDRASEAYVPKQYAGPVTVFKPRVNYDFLPDPEMGWGEVVTGGLEVVELGANPHAMLVEPYVRDLATELKRRLDAVT